jgi:hypothetical protein
VHITIIDYIKDMIEGLPDDMDGVAATAAANHLFMVTEDGNKLDKPTVQLFHHYGVAKALCLCKRARPEMYRRLLRFLPQGSRNRTEMTTEKLM